MKRITALLLALLMCLSCTCALADDLSRKYDKATRLMSEGDYAAAAEGFAALTGYGDAPQMAIYCRGLACAAGGEYDLAVMAFTALGDFKDSPVQALYFTGIAAQAKAEAAYVKSSPVLLEQALIQLDAAEAAYGQLLFLPDAAARLEACAALRVEIKAAFPAARSAHAYEWIGYGDEERFIVARNGYYGVMDASGCVVVPCVYDQIESIYGRLLVVSDGAKADRRNARFGVIDVEGHEILPMQYSYVYLLPDRILVYTDNWDELYFTHDGQPIETDMEDSHLWYSENILIINTRVIGDRSALDAAREIMADARRKEGAWVVLSGDSELWGYLAADGTEVLPPIHSLHGDVAQNLYLGECMVLESPDGAVSAFGSDGRKLFDSRWDYIAYVGSGMFLVNVDELIGYVDMAGNTVAPCMYEDISYEYSLVGMSFVGDLVVVKLPGSGMGCIDTNGRTVIPCEWEQIACTGSFIVGLQDDQVTVMNHQGRVLLEGLDENDPSISAAATGTHFAIVQAGQLTIYDTEGNIVY